MNATEKQVQVAACMYEMRSAAKTLLGARYSEVMTQLGKMLQLLAEKRQIELLDALKVVIQNESNPYNAIQFTAAAVEIVKPS